MKQIENFAIVDKFNLIGKILIILSKILTLNFITTFIKLSRIIIRYKIIIIRRSTTINFPIYDLKVNIKFSIKLLRRSSCKNGIRSFGMRSFEIG